MLKAFARWVYENDGAGRYLFGGRVLWGPWYTFKSEDSPCLGGGFYGAHGFNRVVRVGVHRIRKSRLYGKHWDVRLYAYPIPPECTCGPNYDDLYAIREGMTTKDECKRCSQPQYQESK